MKKNYEQHKKLHRIRKADCCEIIDENKTQKLVARCNDNDGRCGGLIFECKKIVKKSDFFEGHGETDEFMLGYHSLKNKKFYLLSLHCREYFVWKNYVLFRKGANIWMMFDLSYKSFKDLGVQVSGFWRSPIWDKYIRGKKIKVFFVHCDYMYKREYDVVAKVHNQEAYFMFNYDTKSKIDVVTEFSKEGNFPIVGKFYEKLSRTEIRNYFGLRNIPSIL